MARNSPSDTPTIALPVATRAILWLVAHTVYRVRWKGVERVPAAGPALLVGNHVSGVETLLLAVCVRRSVRCLVHRHDYGHPVLRWLMRRLRAIPSGGSNDHLTASLEQARQALRDGQLVCLFAEGPVDRNAGLLSFTPGFTRLVDGLDVPVIPVYLDRVWGSLLGFSGGRLRWRVPAKVPFPVTVSFGRPLPTGTSASDARLALMELGADAAAERQGAHETLGWHFVRTARRRWFRLSMADSTGRRLSSGRALLAGLLLARWLRTHTGGQQAVGLLLPSSVGGALANIAAALAGKVLVNLNFTAGAESMAHAISQCDISTILTSRQFLDRAGLPTLPGMVYLEDVLPAVMTPTGKAWALALALLLPASAIVRLAGSGGIGVDDTATVIFSSGSTGVPKGIVLSHRNILANLDSVEQVIESRSDDMLVGILPFFHSFGFTGTLWFPLVSGFGVVYHPNPMDAKTIGDLAETYRGTMLISTPTFCASYARKCRPEQFQHLRYAIVGAEKLREPVARAFKDTFGVDLIEGYGCSEMSPVVCANLPRVDDRGQRQPGYKPGSVGHPLPGVAAKIADPDTGAGPLVDREGLLLVKGPNRMVGYLGDRTRTQEVIRDGWYVTGDIGVIDEDGCIYITDRLSRFSKIAGEMVPHLKVEESIVALLSDAHEAVVTSVPDASRGERLVVFYTDPQISAHALWERLCRTSLPKLWIPKREDLRFIESIPTLGTGKVDLRGVKRLAKESTGLPASS